MTSDKSWDVHMGFGLDIHCRVSYCLYMGCRDEIQTENGLYRWGIHWKWATYGIYTLPLISRQNLSLHPMFSKYPICIVHVHSVLHCYSHCPGITFLYGPCPVSTPSIMLMPSLYLISTSHVQTVPDTTARLRSVIYIHNPCPDIDHRYCPCLICSRSLQPISRQ